MTKYAYIVVSLIVFVLAGCNPSIGLKTNYSEAEFIIGKTTKNEILSFLGLPHQIVKKDDKREYYYYPISEGWAGSTMGGGTLQSSLYNVKNLDEKKKLRGATYVFDENGILVDADVPVSKKKRRQN